MTRGTKFLRVFKWVMIVGGIMLMLYPPFTDLLSYAEEKKLRSTLESAIDIEAKEVATLVPKADKAQVTAAPVPVSVSSTVNVNPPLIREFTGAVLEIPAIKLRCAVQKGTSPKVLAKSPGWYVESSLPGLGNTAIAGHRTMYGGWFRDLNKLKKGDSITLTHQGYEYYYKIERLFNVDNNDWSVISPNGEAALTLTTCVKGDTGQRFVVKAGLNSCVKSK